MDLDVFIPTPSPAAQTAKNLHPLAGGLALLLIASFFTASLLVEFFGNASQIASVKHLILYGLILLIPALMATGLTGKTIARKTPVRGLLSRKAARMKWIAANGLLILFPSAFALDHLANQGMITPLFYAVQSVELLAGAANLTLLSLNLRDGLRLSKSRR